MLVFCSRSILARWMSAPSNSAFCDRNSSSGKTRWRSMQRASTGVRLCWSAMAPAPSAPEPTPGRQAGRLGSSRNLLRPTFRVFGPARVRERSKENDFPSDLPARPPSSEVANVFAGPLTLRWAVCSPQPTDASCLRPHARARPPPDAKVGLARPQERLRGSGRGSWPADVDRGLSLATPGVRAMHRAWAGLAACSVCERGRCLSRLSKGRIFVICRLRAFAHVVGRKRPASAVQPGALPW